MVATEGRVFVQSEHVRLVGEENREGKGSVSNGVFGGEGEERELHFVFSISF